MSGKKHKEGGVRGVIKSEKNGPTSFKDGPLVLSGIKILTRSLTLNILNVPQLQNKILKLEEKVFSCRFGISDSNL